MKTSLRSVSLRRRLRASIDETPPNLLTGDVAPVLDRMG